jgi:hypothetical protein
VNNYNYFTRINQLARVRSDVLYNTYDIVRSKLFNNDSFKWIKLKLLFYGCVFIIVLIVVNNIYVKKKKNNRINSRTQHQERVVPLRPRNLDERVRSSLIFLRQVFAHVCNSCCTILRTRHNRSRVGRVHRYQISAAPLLSFALRTIFYVHVLPLPPSLRSWPMVQI